MKKAILEMRNISKSFPGVKALDNVDFTLRAGEIHALMGENGAGKSTLIKVLTGVEEFETGDIYVEGVEGRVVNTSPKMAQKNGISTVYQEINLCPNLSVAENIYIDREPKKNGFISWKTMINNAKELTKKLNIPIDVELPLENYSVAIQQMVAIARAVDMSSKVLILDEPTSSLDDQEVKMLFKLMRQLKDQGVGIIFVTHFLEQVYEVCDIITVLRNGALVGEFEIENLPRLELVSKMIGEELNDLEEIKDLEIENSTKNGEKMLVATEMSVIGEIKPFDLHIDKGEIIGFAGLLGSGRSELAHTIYGSLKADSGDISFFGDNLRLRSPKDAINAGMAMVPENRKEEGIIDDLSVRENIMIAVQRKSGSLKTISRKKQDEIVDKYIKMLDIKTASKETPIKQLSGGNQQKVILGRWLATNPKLLILDEPTRGIDIGTKTEIQKLVLELAKDGMSVVFISSELDEMIRTTSRMIIMRDKEKVGELHETQFTHKEIMSAIAGGGQSE